MKGETGRQDSLYALLEIEPGAPDDEIRRAYKRLMGVFDPDSTVVYGLYRKNEAVRLATQLREAYETLLDPEKRRLHDRRLYPKGHPSLRRADERVAGVPPAPRLTRPVDPLGALGLPDDVAVSGEVIRLVRGVCQTSLEEIADRTKISMFTLRCIEGEQFADLPAPVYLRGFLKQVARLLNLDPERTSRDYMRIHEDWRAAEAERKPW